MSGNRVGERKYGIYTDDAGNDFRVHLDKDFIDAAELSFGTDDDTKPNRPKRLIMRHVWGTYTDGSGNKFRKKIPCGSNTCTMYATRGEVVTIATLAFVGHGHIGEKLSRPGGTPLT